MAWLIILLGRLLLLLFRFLCVLPRLLFVRVLLLLLLLLVRILWLFCLRHFQYSFRWAGKQELLTLVKMMAKNC